MSCEIAHFQNVNCSVDNIIFAEIETASDFNIQITNPNTKKSWWFAMTGTNELSADISSVTWDVGVPYEFEIFDNADVSQDGATPFNAAQIGATTYPFTKGVFTFNNVIAGTTPSNATLTLKP